MNEIRVTIRTNKLAYRPGETIEGSASWNLGSAPTALELRLVWYTRGKGTPDISVVDTIAVNGPAAMGDQGFRFQLPEAPHSFSGRLISLGWAVEAVALAARNKPVGSGRVEFTLSPTGAEIVLPAVEKTRSPLESRFAQRKAEWQARKNAR